MRLKGNPNGFPSIVFPWPCSSSSAVDPAVCLLSRSSQLIYRSPFRLLTSSPSRSFSFSSSYCFSTSSFSRSFSSPPPSPSSSSSSSSSSSFSYPPLPSPPSPSPPPPPLPLLPLSLLPDYLSLSSTLPDFSLSFSFLSRLQFSSSLSTLERVGDIIEYAKNQPTLSLIVEREKATVAARAGEWEKEVKGRRKAWEKWKEFEEKNKKEKGKEMEDQLLATQTVTSLMIAQLKLHQSNHPPSPSSCSSLSSSTSLPPLLSSTLSLAQNYSSFFLSQSNYSGYLSLQLLSGLVFYLNGDFIESEKVLKNGMEMARERGRKEYVNQGDFHLLLGDVYSRLQHDQLSAKQQYNMALSFYSSSSDAASSSSSSPSYSYSSSSSSPSPSSSSSLPSPASSPSPSPPFSFPLWSGGVQIPMIYALTRFPFADESSLTYALKLAEEWVNPHDPRYESGLADVLRILGGEFQRTGDAISAEGLMRRAITRTEHKIITMGKSHSHSHSSSSSSSSSFEFPSSLPSEVVPFLSASMSTVSLTRLRVVLLNSMLDYASLLSHLSWNGKSRSPESQVWLKKARSLVLAHPHIRPTSRHWNWELEPDETSAASDLKPIVTPQLQTWIVDRFQL